MLQSQILNKNNNLHYLAGIVAQIRNWTKSAAWPICAILLMAIASHAEKTAFAQSCAACQLPQPECECKGCDGCPPGTLQSECNPIVAPQPVCPLKDNVVYRILLDKSYSTLLAIENCRYDPKKTKNFNCNGKDGNYPSQPLDHETDVLAKKSWAEGATSLYKLISDAAFGSDNPCRDMFKIEICPIFNNVLPAQSQKPVPNCKNGMRADRQSCLLDPKLEALYRGDCVGITRADSIDIELISNFISDESKKIRLNKEEATPLISELLHSGIKPEQASAHFLYTDGRYTDCKKCNCRGINSYFSRVSESELVAEKFESKTECQERVSTFAKSQKELAICLDNKSKSIPRGLNFIAPKSRDDRNFLTAEKTLGEHVKDIFCIIDKSKGSRDSAPTEDRISSSVFSTSQSRLSYLKDKIKSRIQHRIKRVRENLLATSPVQASRQPQLGQQPAPVVSQCCKSLPLQCLPVTARADSYGDVVAVGRRGDWHCSGVAVAQQWVLTARHCLPAEQVMAGIDIREGVEARRIVETVVPADPSLDVALVRLDGRLDAVIHLRRRATDQSLPSGVARLVGFGAVDSQGQYGFGRRHNTDLPISGWGCDPGRATTLGCLPASELVIPGSGGRDTCDGDSGGPVFELMPLAAQCCAGRLLGITSRPMATSRTRCGGGGVYVRVDQLDAWIEKTTHQQTAPSTKENE